MCFYFEAFPAFCYFFWGAGGLKWLYLSRSRNPGRVMLFTVGYWVSRGLEWSGVGCGSHIPPETQITLQETPALQDTHRLTLWFINRALYGTHIHTHSQRHTFKSQPLALSQYTPPSLTHFPPFLSFLPAFPVILKLLAALMFAPSVLDHSEDKRHQMFVQIVTSSVKWFLRLTNIKVSSIPQI